MSSLFGRALLLLFLILCRAAPAAAQETPVAYAGCYRIVQGEWDSRLRPGYHPNPAFLPAEIQLDTLPLEGWPIEYLRGARVARSLSAPGDSSYQFLYWQQLDDDSIYVARPLPWSGFSMKLAATSARLEGHVSSFTDGLRESVPSEVSAPVALERFECPGVLKSP
jgi:hypothetical protein